jgi:hypothetical protein
MNSGKTWKRGSFTFTAELEPIQFSNIKSSREIAASGSESPFPLNQHKKNLSLAWQYSTLIVPFTAAVKTNDQGNSLSVVFVSEETPSNTGFAA